MLSKELDVSSPSAHLRPKLRTFRARSLLSCFDCVGFTILPACDVGGGGVEGNTIEARDMAIFVTNEVRLGCLEECSTYFSLEITCA